MLGRLEGGWRVLLHVISAPPPPLPARFELRRRGSFAPAAPAGGGGEEAAAEKTEFDLVITDVDASKRIAIIKVVRGLTSLGLKEAKDAVTNLPFTILEGKSKAEMDRLMLGELTNGRLAMMAFVGMVIQTLLFDKPLMDMHM